MAVAKPPSRNLSLIFDSYLSHICYPLILTWVVWFISLVTTIFQNSQHPSHSW